MKRASSTLTRQRRQVFGTQEWACTTANCIRGCWHDCKYCYAKAMAIRFGRKTAATWKVEEPFWSRVNEVCKVKPCRVMFPSTHDIRPENLLACLEAIDLMLRRGHELLIVTKPHVDCIETICRRFREARKGILFRFTIGSAHDQVLRFWEPNAPCFMERLDALCLAHERGYQTSVSCEPMLDGKVEGVVEVVSPFVTDSIWIGKANQLRARLKINGADEETLKRGDDLVALQNDERIRDLYGRLKDNAKVRWKESIKKVVGIEVPTEPGLDV